MPVYKNEKRKSKDGRKWFYKCQYTDIQGNHKTMVSKMYATKEEATKEEAKFKLSIGQGTNQDYTFNQMFNEYYNYKSDKVRPTSLSRLTVQYKHIEPYLGNVKISKLTLQQFIQWKNELNKTNLSTNYKNKIYSLIQELIRYSDKMYNINSVIPEKIGKFVNPTEIKKEMDFYTYDEFQQFINVVDDLTYKCFFSLIYYCGLRLGEAQSLNWNDIDFKSGKLSITKSLTTKLKGQKYVILPPKTKNSIRTLPIPNKVLELLKMLYKECANISGFNKDCFVFGIFYPLPDTTIKQRRDNYCKKADIRKIRIHDFRHSCASLLINNGANITLVAKYLGHSNISMTLNTYSHMYKSKLEEIVELIDKM